MKISNQICALTVITLLCSGCEDKEITKSTTKDHTIEVSTWVAKAKITEVYLKDGTRCAVLLAHNKGSITCDWNGEKHGDTSRSKE
jgi:phosphopantothenate synthetase